MNLAIGYESLLRNGYGLVLSLNGNSSKERSFIAETRKLHWRDSNHCNDNRVKTKAIANPPNFRSMFLAPIRC